MNNKKSHHNYKQPLEIHMPSDEKIKEIAEMQKKMERMYHYTSMNTFFKIIDGAKDGVFTFHAGSIYTMNDKQEMTLGFEKLKECLPIIEQELNISANNSLLNLLEDKSKNKEIEENFGKWLVNDDITNFVVSFSAAADILPMWALYGDKGTGVCLEFSPFVIEDFYEQNFIKSIQIDSCVYKDSKIKEFLYNKLNIVYNQFLKDNDDSKRTNPLVKIKYLALACGIACAYIKHKGFEYEQEIRMNILSHKSDWKFTDSHTAYIEIPIPQNALTKIIVGPATDIHHIKNSLILSMRTKGIRLEPIQSTIPFRI